MADITSWLAGARETLASLPPEKWERIEKGRIYLAGGGMIASVREQIPGGIDPDGDDPEAWEIGDAAVEEAGRRAEAVALLVNAREALLSVAEAAAGMQAALRATSQHPNAGDRGHIAVAALDAALLALVSVPRG